jgi:hypothetical protein
MTVDEQVRPNGRARMVTRPFIEPAWAFDYVDQGGGEVLIGYRRTVARSRWARRWEVEVQAYCTAEGAYRYDIWHVFLTPVDEADGSDERKTALLQANFVGAATRLGTGP